uniref:Alpha/beta hydrolase n=1 Tax=Phenylobacterium glaciei TaxID=2803784 RepID=A0A974SB15_9CAUL|nr:alpha/beta hydrolase [Phenylobacterium glaciei]
MSGLLYRPASATAATPAPAVLASHGYINTREMQSPFAIELSRRGFVVLAMDMTGHGGSGAAVGQQGFGGPAALRYLRALDYVDAGNIGLEGHSLGRAGGGRGRDLSAVLQGRGAGGLDARHRGGIRGRRQG